MWMRERRKKKNINNNKLGAQYFFIWIISSCLLYTIIPFFSFDIFSTLLLSLCLWPKFFFSTLSSHESFILLLFFILAVLQSHVLSPFLSLSPIFLIFLSCFFLFYQLFIYISRYHYLCLDDLFLLLFKL